MGTFSSSANAGNLLGSAVFSIIIFGLSGQWYTVTILTAVIMAVMAILFAAFGEERPGTKYQKIIEEADQEVSLAAMQSTEDKKYDAGKKDGISFFAAWKVDDVAVYAFSFAAIKSINYGLFMWLPYYIVEGLGESNSQGVILASEYDIGTVVGGIVVGHVMDRMGHRCLIMVPMLIIAIPIMLSFRFISGSLFWLFYILVFILGFLIGSVANLVASLISIDVGKRSDIG
jgi:OPA family glycerol-3-phosphate transporter-like MFS transporter 3